jgi:hypothetical protein
MRGTGVELSRPVQESEVYSELRVISPTPQRSTAARERAAATPRASSFRLYVAICLQVLVLCVLRCSGEEHAAPSAVTAVVQSAEGVESVQDGDGAQSSSEVEDATRLTCDTGIRACAVGSSIGRSVSTAEHASTAEHGAVAGAPLEGGVAPMCSTAATCVGAEPEVPEVDRGRFDVLPCDSVVALLRLDAKVRERQPRQFAASVNEPEPQPRLDQSLQLDAVPSARTIRLEPAMGVALPAARFEGLLASAEYRAKIYRPPAQLSAFDAA